MEKIHTFWRKNPSRKVKERISEDFGAEAILAIY
jgi:hypothetical protein